MTYLSTATRISAPLVTTSVSDHLPQFLIIENIQDKDLNILKLKYLLHIQNCLLVSQIEQNQILGPTFQNNIPPCQIKEPSFKKYRNKSVYLIKTTKKQEISKLYGKGFTILHILKRVLELTLPLHCS